MIHFFLSLYGYYQVEHFAFGRSFLLVGLQLLHLEFVDVVRCELSFHDVGHQVSVHLLGSLFFLLERLLSTLVVRRHSPSNLIDYLP